MNGVGGSSQPLLNGINTNAGAYIDPYTIDNDPLHYLMYTLQQQTDHFGSNGPGNIGNGNNNLYGDPRSEELALLIH